MAEPDPESAARFKRLEVELQDKAAHNSLRWYETAHGIYSQIEIATVIGQLALDAEHDVLDVGCGVGRATLNIAPMVRAVTAIDISPRSIEMLSEYAAQNGFANVTARAGDMNALELEPASFDRALAVESIQHVPNETLRLDAVRRVFGLLKSGGRFVTVNYRWGGIIAPPDEKESVHGDGRYRMAFVPSELGDLLATAGFEQVRVGGCVNLPYRLRRVAAFWPPPFVAIDRLLSHSPWSTRTGKYLIASGIKP